MTPAPNSQRILMLGYYGHGNFGDDLLMNITHRLLTRILPGAAISIVVNSPHKAYVQSMLGDVTVLDSGRHGHFDRIVHGGGGVFFDFNRYGITARLQELLLRCFGWRHYLALEKTLRKLLGKSSTSATRRIGLGIGIGNFAPGSRLMLEKLPTLADFAALWLRDQQSFNALKRFGSVINASLIPGSDLAFLTDEWLPTATNKPTAIKPALGIILRDWPTERGGTNASKLADTIAQLAEHYTITGFIFDVHTDHELQTILAPYITHIWCPKNMSIDQFSALLQAQDILLTSRAHGAICGACLGVASVIVNIEPKLEQVHAMLPNASILVPAQQPERWLEAINTAQKISANTIAADVAKNRAASEAALQQISPWLA